MQNFLGESCPGKDFQETFGYRLGVNVNLGDSVRILGAQVCDNQNVFVTGNGLTKGSS